MRQIYIAADGGGTKLELGAVSSQGELITTVRVDGGINRKTSDEKTVENNIVSAFEKLNEQTGGFEALGCAGFFMYNTEIFSRAAGCEAISLDEGTLGLYAAGIYGNGVLILSGTGADVFVSKGGKTVGIIGGYGAILGDEGSGFAIAKHAVSAGLRGFDRSGPATSLTNRIFAFYNVKDVSALLEHLYQVPFTSGAVAAFAPEVFRCAEEGDAVAFNILKDQARRFALTVKALLQKLPEDTPLGLWGGMFQHHKDFAEQFSEYVKIDFPGCRVGLLPNPPEYGAVLAAMQTEKKHG